MVWFICLVFLLWGSKAENSEDNGAVGGGLDGL